MGEYGYYALCFEKRCGGCVIHAQPFSACFIPNVVHSAEEIIVYSNKEKEKDGEKFIDKSTGLEMEQAIEPQSLLEWFTEKYKEFGANLEFVTNRSQEGAQFVKGFGGIGGLLRYKVDFMNLTSIDEEDDDEFFSDSSDI